MDKTNTISSHNAAEMIFDGQNRTSKTSTKKGGVLIIVENLPVPFDRRVWQEATTLEEAGYQVSVICPKGRGYNQSYERLNGINIYRHPQPFDASSAFGYLLEYSTALFWEFFLSLHVLRKHGFDVVHACNPPDLLFLIGAFYKLFFGKKFLFDQHDLNPELYEVKFGKKGFFYKVLQMFERWTFKWADVSLATNETFKEIAISRGSMASDNVMIVKSYPDLERFVNVPPSPAIRRHFDYMTGYIGIMGNQDGVDNLVHAMAHIVHKQGRTDIGCLIIGDGPELENLQAMSQDLGISDYITFTGYLSGDALLEHLCSMDIGVIPDPPSACNNKLSMNKVFEYMALGLPFVQYNLTQAKKEAGPAALIVEDETPEGLAEGMLALINDKERCKKMTVFGKEHAQREFHWEGQKKPLLDAYEKLFTKEA